MNDHRPLSKYDDPELELFVRAGRTIPEIAAIYGFHVYDVERYLRGRRPGLFQTAVENLAARDRAKAQSIHPPGGTSPDHKPPP